MISEQMQECINQCWSCRDHCQKTLFNYCLLEGGKHVDHSHVKIMIDCIDICQLVADFMVRHSIFSNLLCKICSQICTKCAEECEKIGDERMKECAQICRECAKSCNDMSDKK